MILSKVRREVFPPVKRTTYIKFTISYFQSHTKGFEFIDKWLLMKPLWERAVILQVHNKTKLIVKLPSVRSFN